MASDAPATPSKDHLAVLIVVTHHPSILNYLRRAVIIAVLGLSSGLFAEVQTVLAASGDLDPSFGTGGKVTTDLGGLDYASAVIAQADGKLLVAGGSLDLGSLSTSIAVVRYNPDGSLDQSFGTGGKALAKLAPGEGTDGVGPALLQADGKLVVASASKRLVKDTRPSRLDAIFQLARFNPDGSIDDTFGSKGTVATTFTGHQGTLSALAIQPDGAIVLAGSTSKGQDAALVLARYTPDGSLDSTFGAAGIVRTAAGPAPGALVILPDGKLLTAGSVVGFRVSLARYTRDGSLDPNFGEGGIATSLPGASLLPPQYRFYPRLIGLTVTSDGKLLAGATLAARGNADFGLIRFNEDGSLDPTFGTDGVILTDLGGPDDEAGSLAIQADGKLVLAGSQRTIKDSAFSSERFALARYAPDGALDRSFGSTGTVTTDVFGTEVWPSGAAFYAGAKGWAVAIQADGNIVVVGTVYTTHGPDFALTRFLA